MKTLTLAAAAVIATVTGASATSMPADLVAEWCHVGDGAYVAAKKACKKSRDIVFFVDSVGFHIRFNDMKPMYLCVPLQVKASGAAAWRVTAACGLNDNSGPVGERSFTFKLTDDRRMLLSFGDQHQ